MNVTQKEIDAAYEEINKLRGLNSPKKSVKKNHGRRQHAKKEIASAILAASDLESFTNKEIRKKIDAHMALVAYWFMQFEKWDLIEKNIQSLRSYKIINYPGMRAVAEDTPLKQKIINVIRDNAPVTASEIVMLLGNIVSYGRLIVILRGLRACSLVSYERNGMKAIIYTGVIPDREKYFAKKH